jgi:2-succinyl-5-enolpyruvyl-6-hydroxy-3-cyclohexene-1-carboxylate synthase
MRIPLESGSAVAAAPNRNVAFAAALLEELARGGVRHLCLCPGSRSAPLAIAAAATSDLRVWTHVDERSAAFFALGLAKAGRAPVALVCTSGTAAANFLPAIVEAFHAQVPLVVLTADRPPELRGVGAPQTIDQARLFGTHARWFAEAAVPERGEAAIRTARSLACRALAESTGATQGPVHLNLPFHEPLDAGFVAADELDADAVLALRGRAPAPYTRVTKPVADACPETLAFVSGLVLQYERGVIAAGSRDLDDATVAAVAALADAAGWPLLAEPAAQLRSGAHVANAPVVAHADWILRDAEFAAAYAPDVVLRLGPMPTSKAFRLWIERHPPAHAVVVDPGGAWEDPSALASAILRVDPLRLAERVLRQVERRLDRHASAWRAPWSAADAAVGAVLAGVRQRATDLAMPVLVHELAHAMPDGALLCVANSMAIRDVDAYWPAGARRLRVLANRGANGIDGLVSSALGAAAASGAPTVLLTGDLALLHDVGGLVAAHRHALALTIVVIDDDGGGIFSLLPVATNADRASFEALFRMPHGLDLARVASGFGARVARLESAGALRAELARSIGAPGLQVLAVPLDRARDVALRRQIERDVTAALVRTERAA